MSGEQADPTTNRRRLLRATGGALTLPLVGSVRADTDDHEDHDHEDGGRGFGRCPDATLEPSMIHCPDASMEGCADDHPETQRLQAAAQETLETQYPTVGALLDQDFLPYFDVLRSSEEGYSHWLSPEFIDDEGTLDPERPESVLVDNEWWQPIGVMFIATEFGEPVDVPPAVYGEGEPDPERCSPWHAHVGLPGRVAWWYYRQVYEGDFRRGDVLLPCETPCMMHVWTVSHPDGIYAHDPPPSEDRREPADPGFETDAEPGEDPLEWDHLPDDVVPDRSPEEYLRRFEDDDGWVRS